MALNKTVAAAVVAVVVNMGAANATDLTGNLTADNAFFAYISTSPTAAGTLIASGNNWPSTFSLTPTTLTPGQTNYLNIEVINYGGPGAFIGQFSLSDTGFQFANGSQSLVTDTANWTGSFNNSNSAVAAQPWVPATGTVFAEGPNGIGPWGGVGGVDPSAQWIWPNDSGVAAYGTNGACAYCTVDLTATISPVPLPGGLSLFAGGLIGLGVMSWRSIRHKTTQA